MPCKSHQYRIFNGETQSLDEYDLRSGYVPSHRIMAYGSVLIFDIGLVINNG